MSDQNQVTLIPMEILFGNPKQFNPQLSPNGKKMAYIAPDEGVLNIWMGELKSNNYVPITKDRDRGIRNYMWSEDEENILYLRDKDGDENWQLYGIHLESGQEKEYTPFPHVQVQLLEHNHHHPSELLFTMNKENPALHDVYHLDLKTGEFRLVVKNPGTVIGWIPHENLEVPCALSSTPEGGMDLLIRNSSSESWKNFISWAPKDGLNSGPLCLSKDGKCLYARDSRGVNGAHLVKISLENGEVQETLLQDPLYDVAEVLFHPETKVPQMASFVKARLEWTVLDESIKKDIEAVGKLHSGDFSISSRNRADSLWIIEFSSDNEAVSYYLFDRSTQKGKFLFNHRPELEEYELAKMEPISFQSRDNLTIHGYISYPPHSSRKNLPMVLNVHGGPWHRDVWGLNPEVQWLTNRGYVCLQVNFRGSTGYGKEFLNGGNREWGGKMQDDLSDAVQWAIDQGIADPKRIAIYGGSYGGYASLAGAVFTPELYACAVDIVGPSNLLTFIETIPEYWKVLLGMMYERVGHPEKDKEFLKSRSPFFHIHNLKIPLLIAQGANDPRVKESEAEQIVEVLKKNKIPFEYMLFSDEGHGFTKPQNRLKFYNQAEIFLANHLKK